MQTPTRLLSSIQSMITAKCSNLNPTLLPCPAVFSITAVTPSVFSRAKLIDWAIRARHSSVEISFKWLPGGNSIVSIPAVRNVAFRPEKPPEIWSALLPEDVRGWLGSCHAVVYIGVRIRIFRNSPWTVLCFCPITEAIAIAFDFLWTRRRLWPLWQTTKIAKGESRDKRKPHFRFGYTEPHPIFVLTKIKKFSGTIYKS